MNIVRTCWRDLEEALRCDSDELIIGMAWGYLSDHNHDMTRKLLEAFFINIDESVILSWMIDDFIFASNATVKRLFPHFLNCVKKNSVEMAEFYAWRLIGSGIQTADLDNLFNEVRRGNVVITYSDSSKSKTSIF